MITIRGQILVSRTDDDPSLPCVHSKRPRVCVQTVSVCTGTARTCRNTCARGAGRHGDVLNVHTEAFLNPHTHKHTHTHQTHTTTTTTHTKQHNTQHLSNASLFCGTLKPTRMRWECGQVRVTRLRKRSNCAGVQWCQVCAPINTLPQLELSLRSS